MRPCTWERRQNKKFVFLCCAGCFRPVKLFMTRALVGFPQPNQLFLVMSWVRIKISTFNYHVSQHPTRQLWNKQWAWRTIEKCFERGEILLQLQGSSWIPGWFRAAAHCQDRAHMFVHRYVCTKQSTKTAGTHWICKNTFKNFDGFSTARMVRLVRPGVPCPNYCAFLQNKNTSFFNYFLDRVPQP